MAQIFDVWVSIVETKKVFNARG